jgi:hypothetical protein
MFMLALAAAALAAPAQPDPTVTEITQLEHRWGQAFVTRDFRFIDRIVAPEYRLVAASPDGKYAITRRAEWMKNAQDFKSYTFDVETVDVSHEGNTAVASAQGVWGVSRRPGEAPRATRFFVTDTWLRRGGHWAGDSSVFSPSPHRGVAPSDARNVTAEVRRLSALKPTCG